MFWKFCFKNVDLSWRVYVLSVWWCLSPPWLSRAFVYLSQNNYSEAHTCFSGVLKIDPKNPVVGTQSILICKILKTFKLYTGDKTSRADWASSIGFRWELADLLDVFPVHYKQPSGFFLFRYIFRNMLALSVQWKSLH